MACKNKLIFVSLVLLLPFISRKVDAREWLWNRKLIDGAADGDNTDVIRTENIHHYYNARGHNYRLSSKNNELHRHDCTSIDDCSSDLSSKLEEEGHN
ncbi:hypothetical protein L6164_017615 [Bauhinia variegata]|uniref:Uncharacterized protein n=1 Tax=Bauhinia variegata TaxID=167791 RepID=A0ACB9NBZ5_BAUVA|nr:hypothetical protein L6164_017615 [Bauhinia variegata]